MFFLFYTKHFIKAKLFFNLLRYSLSLSGLEVRETQASNYFIHSAFISSSSSTVGKFLLFSVHFYSVLNISDLYIHVSILFICKDSIFTTYMHSQIQLFIIFLDSYIKICAFFNFSIMLYFDSFCIIESLFSEMGIQGLS